MRTPLVDQQFGYAAPLLDLAGISTKFSGVITTQFCFTYTLEGVTAMWRGLHDYDSHINFSWWIFTLFCTNRNRKEYSTTESFNGLMTS